jgi:hypothetical protein
MEKQLYVCQNTEGTQTTYKKGTSTVGHSDVGICLGMSVVWCRNMLDGKAPKLTQPDFAGAAAVQVIYQMRKEHDPTRVELLRTAGMTVVNVWNSQQGILETIIKRRGIYLLSLDIRDRNEQHAVAAANQNDIYYFFEPQSGLYEDPDAGDFITRFYGYQKTDYKWMWQVSK